MVRFARLQRGEARGGGLRADEDPAVLPHLHGRSHPQSIDLAEKLIEIAPVKMSKVLFQSSGSEANDTAIKLIWYYHNAIGKPKKKKIIGRTKGYHGTTAASVSLSGQALMHAASTFPWTVSGTPTIRTTTSSRRRGRARRRSRPGWRRALRA